MDLNKNNIFIQKFNFIKFNRFSKKCFLKPQIVLRNIFALKSFGEQKK
jgi:hypothetical protein